MKERIISFNWGTKREKLNFVSSDRERKMAKNRGICAAHRCIPQYREYLYVTPHQTNPERYFVPKRIISMQNVSSIACNENKMGRFLAESAHKM